MTDSYQKHKDSDPLATIHTIRTILLNLKILYTENWLCTTSGSYSVRITDTIIKNGVNGKGTTPAFTLASAYGECLERIQGGMYLPKDRFFEETWKYGGFYLAPDEIWSVPEDVHDRNDRLVDQVTSDYWKGTQDESLQNLLDSIIHHSDTEPDRDGKSQSDTKKLTVLKKWMEQFSSIPDKLLCLPFYSVRERSIVALPERIVSHTHGSNGLCAGNTEKEALVQGMAEVLERYAEWMIMEHALCPPTIPRNALSAYPELIRLIQEIEEKGDFTVVIKDCSLGKGIPVIMSVLIDTGDQRYHCTFGSHPDFPVAVERTLTELLQGFDLGNASDKDHYLVSIFKDLPPESQNPYNFQIQTITRRGVFHPRFFTGDPDWKFENWPDRSNYTNDENLICVTELLLTLGSDIYIRDLSYLGIPAYRIVVPGISHAPMDRTQFDRLASERKMASIVHSLPEFRTDKLNILLKALIHRLAIHDFDPVIPGISNIELIIATLLGLGRNAIVIPFIDLLKKSVQKSDFSYYSCLSLIFLPGNKEMTHDECKDLASLFYGKELAERVFSDWVDTNPFIHLMKKKETEDTESIREINRIQQRLKDEQMRNPVNQMHLQEIFTWYG